MSSNFLVLSELSGIIAQLLNFIDKLSRFITQLSHFITHLLIFIDIHLPNSKRVSSVRKRSGSNKCFLRENEVSAANVFCAKTKCQRQMFSARKR
ncbi:hypothetical protein, partial [Lysinibacillus sp. RC79]|uniref:hypothetical protein n=1 Tax=Lysinibacillus sp. RC79 TaxID=3156296 RepID=UPI0035179213